MRKSFFVLAAYMFFCRFIPVIPYYALFLQQVKRFETSQILVLFSLYGIGVMLAQAALLLVTAQIGKAGVAANFAFLNTFMAALFIVICYVLIRARNTEERPCRIRAHRCNL